MHYFMHSRRGPGVRLYPFEQGEVESASDPTSIAEIKLTRRVKFLTNCTLVQEGWRRGSDLNRRMEVLQTSTLPLGYRASIDDLEFLYPNCTLTSVTPHRVTILVDFEQMIHPADDWVGGQFELWSPTIRGN